MKRDLGLNKDFMNGLVDKLQDYIKSKYENSYYEMWAEGETICVEVVGDWKHDHGFVRNCIDEYLSYLGYSYRHYDEITEDSDSDWYGAIHYFELTDVYKARKYNFIYGMEHRPYDIGCQPNGAIRITDTYKKPYSFLAYYDVISYDRPLTAKETADYQLSFYEMKEV